MKFKEQLLLTIILGISAGIFLIFLAFLFKNIPKLFSTLVFLAIFVSVLPPSLILYADYKRKKEIEEMFPVFLRDLVEAVRGGLTIPQAFRSVCRNDYKALNPYVRKVASQLDWGIPLEKALLNMVRDTKSSLIARTVTSIIETHRFGGRLAETIESLSKAALEIERLRIERKVLLQSQTMTGYVIFFVFIGVIVGLEKFLLPGLTQQQMFGAQRISPAEYKNMFRDLIFLQSFFAGLMVGKMAEGSILAGLKHSLIMMLIGGLAYFLIG